MTAHHTIDHFPASRLATFDVGRLSRAKHQMVALLEVDVTRARGRLRAARRAGAAISFLAWFMRTAAVTVAEHPAVHGVLRGRTRVVYREVDIALLVEREVDGTSVPLPVVIRDCGTRSALDIEREIRAAGSQEISGTADYQLGRHRLALATSLFYRLPQLLRIAVMRAMLRRPGVRKANMGTVVVTSLAAGTRYPAWMVPKTIHNLAFGLGSVVRKPRVVGEAVEPRDVLHLTVLLDHDVVDGAPAARFVSKLVANLERGFGLDEENTAG